MAKKDFMKASVLAYEKKLAISDGYMYGTTWDEREIKATAIPVVEKTVRATRSDRKAKPEEMRNANPQTIDYASLHENEDTLKVKFTMKVLSGVQNPSACNNKDYLEKIVSMVNTYIEETGCKELGRRYAMNLANGRFLWRNRVGAEKLEIRVSVSGEDKNWCFDGYQYPLSQFEKIDPKVKELGTYIAEALSGKREFLLLEVTAYCQMGKSQEIYPSEELVMDKGNSNKGKILYKVGGVAALHSQKIGNAVRTIDTWYDDDAKPIAVDPFGAVTTIAHAYRDRNTKKDFYTLFDSWVLDGKLEKDSDKDFVMAVLVRGGVFGDSGK